MRITEASRHCSNNPLLSQDVVILLLSLVLNSTSQGPGEPRTCQPSSLGESSSLRLLAWRRGVCSQRQGLPTLCRFSLSGQLDTCKALRSYSAGTVYVRLPVLDPVGQRNRGKV